MLIISSNTSDTMTLKLTYLKENNDGSATCLLETDPETTRMLIERGMISLLEDYIDACDEKDKDTDE